MSLISKAFAPDNIFDRDKVKERREFIVEVGHSPSA
jgi:hypothetical protein